MGKRWDGVGSWLGVARPALATMSSLSGVTCGVSIASMAGRGDWAGARRVVRALCGAPADAEEGGKLDVAG